MTRLRKRLLVILAALCLVATGAGAAAAAVLASGPPVSSPAATAGSYFSGPVHECVSAANESAVYVEGHSTALGNCARGYVQMAANELTPKFTLQLGSTAYTCSASTAAAETALTCAAPSPSPSPSSSAGG